MTDLSVRDQMIDDALEHELENVPMKENCDMIRRKIRSLIDNGDMKVGEFQKAVNITPNAYSRFMGQNGPEKGMESSVFPAAWAFFKKREMLGIKPTPTKKAAAATGKDAVPNVDDVELDMEKDDKVPVFDTCDEIRRKINAHLKKPGVTAAAFCRAISASFHKAPKKISSAQLSAFRSKKGPYAGNTSAVFYGSYVYFEKIRIKEGKPKSRKRQEMEEIHAAQGGIPTDHMMDKFTCRADERPSVDSLGRVTFHKV
ncbi:hypothetical protein NX059_002366 [Plenodomus lindquistii]|nr:hypothetical protein NX059_002366 [Plenodomus lindquistii]